MEAQDEGVKSYRELLRYVLQEYETSGGRLQYPVGCYHLEDWLLDSLNVPKLLLHLKTERSVSLVNLCEGEAGVQSIKSLAASAPGPLAQGFISNKSTTGTNGQLLPIQSLTNEQESDLHLSLPKTVCVVIDYLSQPPHMISYAIRSGMTDEHLQYLAYTLFVGSCSSYCSEGLTDSVREQLKMTSASADSLQHLLAEAANLQSQAASSLEMITMLLQIGRPRHFDCYEAFAAWRQSYVSAVCQSLILGAAESASESRSKDRASLRPELLRLKMYMRMLDIPVSEDYDEDVYTDGVVMTVRVASNVAKMSGLGWCLPWAIKVKVGELLMAAGIDSRTGHPFPDQDQLQYVLRHHLWPLLSLPLSLHDCLNAWAYLKVFSVTGNTDLLAQGKELIEEIPRRPNGGANGPGGVGGSPYKTAMDPERFVDDTLKSVIQWTAGRLSKYREFVDAGPIPSLLSILIACQRCLGLGSIHTSELLEKCIQSSVQAEFDKSIQALKESTNGVPKDSDWIVQVSECCSDLLDEEVSYFSPLFTGVLKRPAEVSGRQIHKCFNSYLLPFLQTVHTLDDENLEAIRAAVKLESRLQTLLGDSTSGYDWAILERLTPLLHLWVSNQLSMLDRWHERLWESESWKPISEGGKGCSRSAPEMIKIAQEMLDLMFNLHLGIPDEVVTAACSGLDNLFQRYARSVAAELKESDFFVPTTPPLTRYKKDIKEKAAAASYKPSKVPEAGLQRRWSPEQERLAAIPTSSLVVRLNSLHYVRDQLSALSQIVYDRFDTPEGADGLWAERMFDATRYEISRSLNTIAVFICTKVVFQDLEKPVSEVYKHTVSGARIDLLLESINEMLAQLMEIINEDLRDNLSSSFMQVVVDAFVRILLHGGSNRWYKASDVPLIEEDMDTLKQFFYQGGDGVPMEEINTKFVEIYAILDILRLDTQTLISNLKQAQQQEKMGVRPARNDLAHDPKFLLPILAHREDHAASKYLKKEYALPKKAESGGLLAVKANSATNGQPKKKGFGLFGR